MVSKSDTDLAKVVVGLGKLPLFDLIDLELKGNFLTGQVLIVVIFGKGDVEGLLLTHFKTQRNSSRTRG